MLYSHLVNIHAVQTPAAQCAAGTRVRYMCLQVQAQVQCTDALVHRCTGTVYQQVILQVQCELCSVLGINTMYSVQCNVHTSN